MTISKGKSWKWSSIIKFRGLFFDLNPIRFVIWASEGRSERQLIVVCKQLIPCSTVGIGFLGEIRNENHFHRRNFEPIGFYCAIRGRMGLELQNIEENTKQLQCRSCWWWLPPAILFQVPKRMTIILLQENHAHRTEMVLASSWGQVHHLKHRDGPWQGIWPYYPPMIWDDLSQYTWIICTAIPIVGLRFFELFFCDPPNCTRYSFGETQPSLPGHAQPSVAGSVLSGCCEHLRTLSERPLKRMKRPTDPGQRFFCVRPGLAFRFLQRIVIETTNR